MGPHELPDTLFDFAFFPAWDDKLAELNSLAEKEDWDYHRMSSAKPFPVLSNYLKYTYVRLAEEKKIVVTPDEKSACFNLGLVTPAQEPLFAIFDENHFSDRRQFWHFDSFCRKGERPLNRFPSLPEMAHYFDDPSKLVFHPLKELRVNIDHIVADNKSRFPAPFGTMDDYQLQTFLKGAIDNARERVRRNYKAAIPQYYNGSIQLLLPLCLSNPGAADLALVVEDHTDFYRAATCLTLDMAYNNARQLARPDRDWLQP